MVQEAASARSNDALGEEPWSHPAAAPAAAVSPLLRHVQPIMRLSPFVHTEMLAVSEEGVVAVSVWPAVHDRNILASRMHVILVGHVAALASVHHPYADALPRGIQRFKSTALAAVFVDAATLYVLEEWPGRHFYGAQVAANFYCKSLRRIKADFGSSGVIDDAVVCADVSGLDSFRAFMLHASPDGDVNRLLISATNVVFPRGRKAHVCRDLPDRRRFEVNEIRLTDEGVHRKVMCAVWNLDSLEEMAEVARALGRKAFLYSSTTYVFDDDSTKLAPRKVADLPGAAAISTVHGYLSNSHVFALDVAFFQDSSLLPVDNNKLIDVHVLAAVSSNNGRVLISVNNTILMGFAPRAVPRLKEIARASLWRRLGAEEQAKLLSDGRLAGISSIRHHSHSA